MYPWHQFWENITENGDLVVQIAKTFRLACQKYGAESVLLTN